MSCQAQEEWGHNRIFKSFMLWRHLQFRSARKLRPAFLRCELGGLSEPDRVLR